MQSVSLDVRFVNSQNMLKPCLSALLHDAQHLDFNLESHAASKKSCVWQGWHLPHLRRILSESVLPSRAFYNTVPNSSVIPPLTALPALPGGCSIRGNPAAQLVAIVDPAERTWSKYNLDMMPTPELATLYGEARLQRERCENR